MENTEVTVSASRKHYLKHRDRLLIEHREHKNTTTGRASRLVAGARKRSGKLGVEFDLDYKWVAEKLDKGVCEVTGIKFYIETGRHPFAPSLDRTDPSKGYTKDNTKVVVWIYNTAKANFSHEDVVTLAEAVLNGKH